MTYRLWVNDERTIRFELWENGEAIICIRETADDTWPAPITVIEEKHSQSPKTEGK
jgi:hypothetical protein